MIVKKKLKFVILGRIAYTDHFVKELNKYGFSKPLVIVSPDDEYIRDKKLLAPYGLDSDLEGLADLGLCDLHKIQSINSEDAMSLMKSYGGDICISINCRNIIKLPVIELFSGNIFNIHDSYLPHERGGALITWKILNNIKEVGNTIHYVDEGIDSGDIVLQKRKFIESDAPKPIDYLKVENKNCEELLSQFVKHLLDENLPSGLMQVNDNSYYYPRLFTEINGAINWDWDIISVERFIRGFSNPYPGAWCYYRNNKIHILDAYIEENENFFHPFSNGKIITILNDGVRVIAGGKSMIITSIAVGDDKIDPKKYLDVKYSLYNNAEDMFRSKHYVPNTLEMNQKYID